MKTAVGYPRVSGMGQGESGYSLPDQVAQIEQYCKDNNLKLVAHFPEVESAKNISGRPSFKAALRHLYAGGADILVVTNLDRFSRSVFDTEALRKSMERHGKKLVSTQQKFLTPLIFDPEDEDEIISMRQKAAIEAELERKRITRRCLRGRMRKAQEGGWTGHRPWFEADVVRGRPVINKERARIVRWILRLRQIKTPTGYPWSYERIAQWLNGENGLYNPDGSRGRKFTPPASREVLKERRRPRKAPLTGLWHKETVRRICQGYDSRVITIARYDQKGA